LDFAERADHHVAGLQVAVDHARARWAYPTAWQIASNTAGHVHRGVRLQQRVERLAADEFSSPGNGRPFAERADVGRRPGDAGVLELAGDAGLVHEPVGFARSGPAGRAES